MPLLLICRPGGGGGRGGRREKESSRLLSLTLLFSAIVSSIGEGGEKGNRTNRKRLHCSLPSVAMGEPEGKKGGEKEERRRGEKDGYPPPSTIRFVISSIGEEEI